MHKYIYIGLCAVIIVLSVGCVYSCGTSKQLDSEARELREDITRYRRTSEAIQNNYIRIATENDRLRQEIINGFSSAYDGIIVIEQGLTEIGEGLNGVLSEMRAYSETVEPAD